MRVALDLLGGDAGVVRSDITELGRLRADNVLHVLDLVVNDFAVLDVDERAKENNHVRHQSETPEWHDLDQAERDESSKEDLKALDSQNGSKICSATYGDCGINILCIEDALALNDEEVEKLLDIVQAGLERLLGNGVVLARTHLRGKTVIKQKLAGNLKGSGDWRAKLARGN